MNYVVRLSAEAERIREEVYLYYLERTTLGAHRWFAAYEQAIDEIAKDPERFAVARENEHFAVKLQQNNFGTKRSRPTHRLLFYRQGTTVYVVTLRHLHQQDIEPGDLPAPY